MNTKDLLNDFEKHVISMSPNEIKNNLQQAKKHTSDEERTPLMKNIRSHQCIPCIYLTIKEFNEILSRYDIYAEVTLDGINYYHSNQDIENSEVYKNLSNYFDITITSVHSDSAEYPGIWIAYH